MMEINANGMKLVIEDTGETSANEKMAKKLLDNYIPSDEAIEDNRKQPIFDIKG